MKIIQKDSKLLLLSDSGEEQVFHLNHTSETLQELYEDSWPPFVVFEQVSNFPRLHLVSAESEYDAQDIVRTYIIENESDIEDEEPCLNAEPLSISEEESDITFDI